VQRSVQQQDPLQLEGLLAQTSTTSSSWSSSSWSSSSPGLQCSGACEWQWWNGIWMSGPNDCTSASDCSEPSFDGSFNGQLETTNCFALDGIHCEPSTCGDGTVDHPNDDGLDEQCDEGKHCENGDSCSGSSDCTDGSSCEMRNHSTDNGLICTSSCQWDGCGDGETDAGEECDYGKTGAVGMCTGPGNRCNEGGSSGPYDVCWCSSTCKLPACCNGINDNPPPPPGDTVMDDDDGGCYPDNDCIPWTIAAEKANPGSTQCDLSTYQPGYPIEGCHCTMPPMQDDEGAPAGDDDDSTV